MHRRTRSNLVAQLFAEHNDRLCTSLRRRFRGVPPDLVAEHVQEAFSVLLQRDALPADPVGLLHTIAWRLVRAEVRSQRVRTRASTALAPGLASPTHRLEARQRLRQVQALVPAAAARFGGRQPQQLREALGVRLTGTTDTGAAATTGVRREAVNRAVRWMSTCLD